MFYIISGSNMRYYLCIFILFFIPHQLTAETDVASVYDSLRASVLEEHKAAQISDILIIRGGQEIYFANGTFRLLEPVRGKYFGAVFTGEGTFTILPPSEMERSEFERQFEWKLTEGKYSFNFNKAVLWFQDTLLGEMGLRSFTGEKEIERTEDEALERSFKYITDKYNKNILHNIITELLEDNPKPYLFAHFTSKDKEEIFFSYDLRRFEEVNILKPPLESLTGSLFVLQLVNSFHTLGEYQNAKEYELASEDKHEYDIIKNNIELSIKKGGDVNAHAALNFHSMEKNRKTMHLLLDSKLIIDSVVSVESKKLYFHQLEENPYRIIGLPEQDTADYTIDIYYHGDLLEPFNGGYGIYSKFTGSFYVLPSSTLWYPQQVLTDETQFEVTFRYPKNMCLMGAGKKESEIEESDNKMSRYTITTPTLINSFSLGFYEETKFQLSDTEPMISVFDVGGGDPERVAEDVANAIRLYSFLFGGCPYQELRVTGGPSAHGQAFQDFIHLPWFVQFVGEQSSRIEITAAHEVAHAWWGHGVKAKSYHDYWLSEALAHYSALMYAPFVLKKDKALFDELKKWREGIASLREYALGSGPKLGSIWLGYRAGSVKTPNDYTISTYMKGALVIHMLRMMLVDLSTMNEDLFKSMLKDFYQSNAGKELTTDDFRIFVEKYFKADMQWFFDQWVYGTEIPTLKCAKSIVKSPGGKYVLSVSVEQKDITNPFIIYLPFELKYSNGNTARARLFINKMKNEFTYELDLEPEEVTFNIMESVLCSIDE